MFNIGRPSIVSMILIFVFPGMAAAQMKPGIHMLITFPLLLVLSFAIWVSARMEKK